MKNFVVSDSKWFGEIVGFFIIAIIVLCWTVRLSVLPGLHGDEAWFGLKAIEYIQGGKISSHGMNSYTGSLQSIATMLSFKLFGINIISLRLFGIVCNVLALCFSWYYLKKVAFRQVALFFIFFLGQSFLFLSYPRIAWEVTSMNFLLVVMYGISLFKLFENKSRYLFLWITLNLIVGFIGSYNHILFSSLLLACLLGLAADFSFSGKRAITPIAVVFIGLFNYSLYFFVLNDAIQAKSYEYFHYFTLLFLIIVCGEAYCLKKSRNTWTQCSNWIFSIKVRNALGAIISLAIVSGTIVFFYFHGLALIQILAGEVVLRRVWAYKMEYAFELYQLVLAFFFVSYLVVKSLSDVINRKGAKLSYIITSYFSIFTLYITYDAPRYYLIIILLFYLTLVVALYERKKIRKILVAFILINFVLNQIVFWHACDYSRKFRPLTVKIGNGRESHASHFLPMQSTIDTLRKYKIGNINSSEDYFIMQPINLYKYIYPEFASFEKEALVEYDYQGSSESGFIVLKKSEGIR